MKSVGNCCTDKAIMEKRVLQETLDRLLWRFSLQNGWDDEKFWSSETIYPYYSTKWRVYCNVRDKKWGIGSSAIERNLCPYFVSKEIAQRAINEVILPFEKEHL